MNKTLFILLSILLLLNSCGTQQPSTKSDDNLPETTTNYRLNDIWALTVINDEPVSFKTEVPNLEFHLVDGKMYGYAGCNNIQGAIIVTKESIAFGPIASSRMACPDMQLENKLLSILSGNTLKYKINGLRLTLSDEVNDLTFKKVD